ncbi:MAG: hypothetical protein H6658_16390 [Ardenticatenaceae bacterium]|nr:hypothetical protein [Ardenticatenaceae bacterium]
MVYMDADNNLEAAGLLDLNEMEAAGTADKINVVVQIDRALGQSSDDGDWTDGRRYRITADEDPSLINSELVAELGEVNMGDPLALADFIGWSIRSYPANRYALIIWDHGAGWNGMAFDSDVGVPDTTDHITLPDLQSALQQALAQNGVDRLDVIGFDACLMGQLELFQAVQPFADFAVGSEELTPGQGWNYTALLQNLYTNTTQHGSILASQMVTDFMRYYTEDEPDDFVTMTAVDLAQLPALTYATELLANSLTVNAAFLASTVGDARSGAEAFARVYADEFDRYAAVDLHHFASILAQRSPDTAVTQAAQAVMTGIETAVIAHEQGSGFKHSQGIAIYFPRNAAFYDEAYARTAQMPIWNSFLTSYHSLGQADVAAPEVHIPNVLRDVVGVQQPAYLDFEVVGRDIENVVLLAGLYLDDGRRLLVEYDNLVPEPTHLPDGTEIVEWRDGIHDDFFVWNTDVTYIYDVYGTGQFVVMWPTELGSSLFTVQGRYRRANATETIEANIVFDHQTNQMTRVWGFSADEGEAPAEIVPQPDDEFQIYTFFLDGEAQISREVGESLYFDANGRLAYEWSPLPDANYFLGFRAENVVGKTAAAFTDLTIQNSAAVPGYKAYLDPYLGFQFLYPNGWYAPRYENTLLYTANLSGTTFLQITLYPNVDRDTNAEVLQAQTLAQFGAVDVLFEETLNVAGANARRMAYGYTKEDGTAHTGIFMTFVQDGTGYVVDVDGQTADEAATVAAMQTMAASWRFVQAGFGLQPGNWAKVDFEAYSVARPADFAYQAFNDWQRFVANKETFVALRTQPATLDTSEVLAALVRDAGAGVNEYEAEAAYVLPLGGAIWQRADFSYTNEDGVEIWGFIMVKVENGREVVAWAEAPATTYNQLETNVFLLMIADLTLNK